HDHEEDHNQAVISHRCVVEMLGAIVVMNPWEQMVHDLDAGMCEFRADDARKSSADEARDDREHKIHRADVLVVGGEEPPRRVPEARAMVAVIGVSGGVLVRHGVAPYSIWPRLFALSRVWVCLLRAASPSARCAAKRPAFLSRFRVHATAGFRRKGSRLS